MLSERKTSQDPRRHIFMWNEAHGTNYSSLNTHTKTVQFVRSMDVGMQINAGTDNITLLAMLDKVGVKMLAY